MTVRALPQARLVATWTDLDCGCSTNEHGAWIIDSRCFGHRDLIPCEVLARWQIGAREQGSGAIGDYGPFRP